MPTPPLGGDSGAALVDLADARPASGRAGLARPGTAVGALLPVVGGLVIAAFNVYYRLPVGELGLRHRPTEGPEESADVG